jgi:hypothetical protein
MRYGLFYHGDDDPVEEYEGDSILLRQPYIEVARMGDRYEVVALIHLQPGQTVREIKDRRIPIGDMRVPTAWR